MLRKGISKRKLLLDLNMMTKRGKIASKAITNFMTFHHHSTSSGRRSHDSNISFAPGDYEFSCSNTPNFPIFHQAKRRHNLFGSAFGCTHAPPTHGDDEVVTASALKAVLEVLNNDQMMTVEASPALPGFGKSPMVRQLRITDSPFPLRNGDDDCHVDEAAEEFIKKFYKNLRQQKGTNE